MDEQIVERQLDSKKQILSATAFQRGVIVLAIVDAALILYLTFGLIFPRHVVIAETPQVAVDWYDYSAKLSPFAVTAEAPQAAKVVIPRLDVRNIDVASLSAAAPGPDGTVTVGAVQFNVANGVSAANAAPALAGQDNGATVVNVSNDANTGAVVNTGVAADGGTVSNPNARPQVVPAVLGGHNGAVIIPTVESIGPKRTT